MLIRVGCCFLQDRTVHLHFGFLVGFYVRARHNFCILRGLQTRAVWQEHMWASRQQLLWRYFKQSLHDLWQLKPEPRAPNLDPWHGTSRLEMK